MNATMSIRDIARHYVVTVSTVRSWVACGMIPPPRCYVAGDARWHAHDLRGYYPMGGGPEYGPGLEGQDY